MSNRYVVMTAVSTFKMRYVIPIEAIEEHNLGESVSDLQAIEFGKDFVSAEEVKDFSQDHLGETIVDAGIYDEETVLKIFNKDNAYLDDWTLEQKIEYIKDWEDPYTKNKKEANNAQE